MSTPEKAIEQSFGVEYFDGLYRYALYLTRNHFDADDVLQQTYALAIDAFGRLRENSNVRAWLFSIMRNVWLLELRGRRNRERTGVLTSDMLDNIESESSGAHEVLEAEEDAVRVRAAIAKLAPQYREVIVLREYEDLSYQEIANVIGCPIGTVMSRLGRSRTKLRLLLSQTEKHIRQLAVPQKK